MFRIVFDHPRSSILNKDLLLHVNPFKTLKNVHTKVGVSSAETQIIDKGKKRGQIGDPVTYQIHKTFL